MPDNLVILTNKTASKPVRNREMAVEVNAMVVRCEIPCARKIVTAMIIREPMMLINSGSAPFKIWGTMK